MEFNILSDYKTLDEGMLDSIKTLRTNIEFASISRKIKTITLTSNIPNEGKSTIATFLAVAMAESNKKTLLVECDFRHTTLRKRMRLTRNAGIINYLSGNVSMDEAITATQIDNLYFLDAEIKVPNPVEIISSDAFSKMIEDLKEEFDYVIFDTPPVGTFIDAALFAARSDATIILLKPGAVDRKLFKKTYEQLTKANANIIGVVFNEVDKSHKGYYYGKYYHKNYKNQRK